MARNNPTSDRADGIAITELEFIQFCDFFYQKTGIRFDEKKRYMVERRLRDRLDGTSSVNFRDYFRHLRFDASGAELQAIVNLLTVNETYFYREDYQFTALVDHLLPEVVRGRRPGESVRIWSIPCSTGEEPYSIALFLLEHWKRADEFSIDISACDIDSNVLEAARAGVYGARSLQRLPPHVMNKYFDKVSGSDYRICDDLRHSVNFSNINIVLPNALRQFRQIDIVFCRNLLIYFDDISRRQAIENLYECMTPGGFICLGHSESMSRMSSLFRPRKFGDSIIYQKPVSAE